MGVPQVRLDLADDPQRARDLAAGGVFVPECAHPVMTDVEVVVSAHGRELVLSARVVFVNATGAGLELTCSIDQKQQLAELAAQPDETVPIERSDPDHDDDDDDEEVKKIPLNIHERLRGLTLAQQVKKAHTGETSERIILERLYGKNVWDALIRNPRVTGPEIARIARMGALPKPQLELICTNAAWLQIPEIRRALLSNPRLSTDQIVRVVRLLPKHELKLVASQPTYSQAVRSAARRLLQEMTL
ncbi:MAG: hypothetical protein QM831_25185 [Kofleriaceae bacterium]